MTSPKYLMPLPLYGSGSLSILILAAVRVTASLSVPLNEMKVGLGTYTFTPEGTGKWTSWANPSLKVSRLRALSSAALKPIP